MNAVCVYRKLEYSLLWCTMFSVDGGCLTVCGVHRHNSQLSVIMQPTVVISPQFSQSCGDVHVTYGDTLEVEQQYLDEEHEGV